MFINNKIGKECMAYFYMRQKMSLNYIEDRWLLQIKCEDKVGIKEGGTS